MKFDQIEKLQEDRKSQILKLEIPKPENRKPERETSVWRENERESERENETYRTSCGDLSKRETSLWRI